MESFIEFLSSESKKVKHAITGIKLFPSWGGLHFKIQIMILIITIALSFMFNFTTDRLVIILILAVIVALMELLNSAFEKTIDYISNKQFDPRARDIKDFMAGVVLSSFLIYTAVFTIFIIWR